MIERRDPTSVGERNETRRNLSLEMLTTIHNEPTRGNFSLEMLTTIHNEPTRGNFSIETLTTIHNEPKWIVSATDRLGLLHFHFHLLHILISQETAPSRPNLLHLIDTVVGLVYKLNQIEWHYCQMPSPVGIKFHSCSIGTYFLKIYM